MEADKEESFAVAEMLNPGGTSTSRRKEVGRQGVTKEEHPSAQRQQQDQATGGRPLPDMPEKGWKGDKDVRPRTKGGSKPSPAEQLRQDLLDFDDTISTIVTVTESEADESSWSDESGGNHRTRASHGRHRRRIRAKTERYKVAPVPAPKYAVGGDWRIFLQEFRDMTDLADMKPSHQLAYLKNAVPDEGKKLLYRSNVETVKQAVVILTELYEPVRDAWTALEVVQSIEQGPEERLRPLVGRIQEAVERYAEIVKLSSTDVKKLVKDRLKYALKNEDTRSHLLWERKEMSLEEMIEQAQTFEDFKATRKTPKKALRATDQSPERQKLNKELADLRRQLEELRSHKTEVDERKLTCLCWNCGGRGHVSRQCKQGKIGNGFTHCPEHRQRRPQGGDQTQTTKSMPNLN